RPSIPVPPWRAAIVHNLADFSATARLIAEPQRQHAGSAPRRDPGLIGVKRRRKLSSIRYRCGDKVNGVAARLAMPIPCSSIAIEVPAPFGEHDDDLRSWPRDTIISGICGARKRFNRPTRPKRVRGADSCDVSGCGTGDWLAAI